MKILKNSFLILLVVLGFTACQKDEQETYYSTLGMLKISTDSTIIESDQGYNMYINNSISNDFEDGDRIVASFSLIEQELPTGIDYIVDIYSIEKVLFKPVIELTPEISDSLGDDPIQVDNMWIAKDYLNLNFSYSGGETTHFINLGILADSTANDTISLEIRHNDNGDKSSYWLGSFASFDLGSVRVQDADSVILKISSQDFYNKTFEECLTYKY
jgi:hypothetical protein